jgi:hypothetical protein
MTVEFEIKGLSKKKQYFKNTNEKKTEKNLCTYIDSIAIGSRS